MSSNHSWVELGVRSTSVLSRTWTQNNLAYLFPLRGAITLSGTKSKFDNILVLCLYADILKGGTKYLKRNKCRYIS